MSKNLLGSTVYLTQEEYDSLVTNGSVTLASGESITYSENDTYYIPETTATTTASGLMSAADKTKLDGITANATRVQSSSTNGNIKLNGVETTVYDDTEIRAIAEGRTETYVMSTEWNITSDNWSDFSNSATKVYKSDDTELANYSAYSTYVSGGTNLNTSTSHFKSLASTITTNFIPSQGLQYFIVKDAKNILDIKYYIILSTESFFKTGDIFLIKETGYPDRWCDGAWTFYSLDTKGAGGSGAGALTYSDANNVLTQDMLETDDFTLNLGIVKTAGSEKVIIGNSSTSSNNELNVATRDTTQDITGQKTFKTNSPIFDISPILKNAVYLKGYNTSSAAKSLIGINSSNNVIINGDSYGNTYIGSGGNLLPLSNTISIGTSGSKWKDGYFSGSLNAASLTTTGQVSSSYLDVTNFNDTPVGISINTDNISNFMEIYDDGNDGSLYLGMEDVITGTKYVSFQNKSGTVALLDDTKIEIVDITTWGAGTAPEE